MMGLHVPSIWLDLGTHLANSCRGYGQPPCDLPLQDAEIGPAQAQFLRMRPLAASQTGNSKHMH